MGSTERTGVGRVNAFPVDERFLFKHYFEGETVFDRLKPYYNNQQYRFEVPPAEFDGLRTFLADHGYLLAVVDDLDPFVVVVEKYTHHPENVFKDSVIQRGDATHNYFLLKDEAAIDRVVRNGATPIGRTDFDHPF
jgi:hypothetical protein